MRYVVSSILAAGLGIAGATVTEKTLDLNPVKEEIIRHIDLKGEEIKEILYDIKAALQKNSATERKQAIYNVGERYGREKVFNCMSTIPVADTTYGELIANRQPRAEIDPVGVGFEIAANIILASATNSDYSVKHILDDMMRAPQDEIEKAYLMRRHEILDRVLVSPVSDELKRMHANTQTPEFREWQKRAARENEENLRRIGEGWNRAGEQVYRGSEEAAQQINASLQKTADDAQKGIDQWTRQANQDLQKMAQDFQRASEEARRNAEKFLESLNKR